MTALENGREQSSTHLQRLSARILEFFPSLEPDSRRTAVLLYRLLAEGAPVSREELARAAGLTVERIAEILEGWTGIFYEQDKIIGFWGLTPRPFSKHLLHYGGRTGYAWCAWDSLFIPELIGQNVEVQSADPETGEPIRLTVTPGGVTQVSPQGAVMSILEPAEEMREDVVSQFCHFIHFFSSPESGEKWVAKHPGTTLLSIEDSFELGKRRNRGQFKEALELPVS